MIICHILVQSLLLIVIIVSIPLFWHSQVFSTWPIIVNEHASTLVSTTYSHHVSPTFIIAQINRAIHFTTVTLATVRLAWPSSLKLTISSAITLIWIIIRIYSWIMIQIVSMASTSHSSIERTYSSVKRTSGAIIIDLRRPSTCKMVET